MRHRRGRWIFSGARGEHVGGGRFVPGDLAADRARLYLVGRVSDVINIAGRKLNPLEVEARLAELPGVRQVVVFGVPSELRGEEAVACVAGEGIEAGDVLRFCQGRLSAWQMPRDVWIVPEIPTNERGKLSRRLLAESFLASKTEKLDIRSSKPKQFSKSEDGEDGIARASPFGVGGKRQRTPRFG